MTVYVCNASIPRPGHTGQRAACVLPHYPDGPQHGRTREEAQHWHPVGHTRQANGWAWRDDTAGAIPHDQSTAVAVDDAPAPDPDEADVPGATGVRFTRVEVQRLIGHVGDPYPGPETRDELRRLLEERLEDYDEQED